MKASQRELSALKIDSSFSWRVQAQYATCEKPGQRPKSSPAPLNLKVVFVILESAEKLQSELRDLRVQFYTLKEQHDDLKEKMKFFTKVYLSPKVSFPPTRQQ